MKLLGLDLNATCARAVHGPVGEYPLALPLDPPGQDLPLVLTLEKHPPQVGRSGLRLYRDQPHLTCSNFLAELGATGPGAMRWQAGRRFVDSSQALAVVWQRLGPACARAGGVVLSLPSYLTRAQADLIRSLGVKQRATLLGSVPSLLAAALAGYAEQTWIGSVVVVDIDNHALMVGLVRAVDGEAHLLETRHFPQLGLKAWQDRLINGLADNCVLQSRRDPRDVPVAEQALFEQLDILMDAALHGRMIQLGIQAPHWYQNLLVHPDESSGFCVPLARQVVREVEAFYQMVPSEEVPPSMLLTGAAGRLPGLALLLRSYMEEMILVPQAEGAKQRLLSEEDFGEGLIQHSSGQIAGVALLAPDAAARAAHSLGAFFQNGDWPRGHLDIAAPLPLPQPLEAGPPRLNFQGQDFFLKDPNFVLGSQTSCHLLFDSRRFPLVAPRHCEIMFDQRAYLLFNRSRDGTFVNDTAVVGSAVLHPGDWIRLGPEGPLVRFLGQSDGRPMTA
jgi:hypothetical protein